MHHDYIYLTKWPSVVFWVHRIWEITCFLLPNRWRFKAVVYSKWCLDWFWNGQDISSKSTNVLFFRTLIPDVLSLASCQLAVRFLFLCKLNTNVTIVKCTPPLPFQIFLVFPKYCFITCPGAKSNFVPRTSKSVLKWQRKRCTDKTNRHFRIYKSRDLKKKYFWQNKAIFLWKFLFEKRVFGLSFKSIYSKGSDYHYMIVIGIKHFPGNFFVDLLVYVKLELDSYRL